MSDPNVTLVVCGAPLAERTADLVRALLTDGWHPTVIGTPAAVGWLDLEAVAALTGEPVRLDFRSPNQPKQGGPPAAVVVCPATFNTVNKAAAGAADTYALAVLCEALGTGTPTVLVPMVNNKLWGHPVWAGSLDVFRRAGAVLLDVHTGRSGATPVESGTGDDVVERFEPVWVSGALKRLLER